MANVLHNSSDLIDMILPVWGQPRIDLPIWDPGRQMFLVDEYESESGNRSYYGVRISDRFVIMEKVGNYHTHTYINSLLLLVYDGKKLKTVAQREFDKVHYDADFIRERSEEMLYGFLESQFQQQGQCISPGIWSEKVKALIGRGYHELLDEKTLPMLEAVHPFLN